jgi:pSer/pThr/pTyr-binding forkhead associated (FHA) protein
MRIRLKDSEIAGFQLFLVRLPCGWLAMNRQPGTRVEFNGWKSDQRLLRAGDVLRLASTWLAFSSPAPISQPMPPIPGIWVERVVPGMPTVRSLGSAPTSIQSSRPSVCVFELPGGREVSSRGEALRIGSSVLCDVRLADPAIAPVQALITWQLDGVHLVNLAGPGLKLANGQPATDHVLRHGEVLRFGDVVVHVRLEGDATAPARLRAAEELTHPPRMALTVVAGPQKGQSAVLPPGEPAVLGRHSECDFSFPTDPYMSRRHLQLIARGGTVEAKDLGSRHGFAIGQTTHTDSATARVGEVLRVGQSFFLVHYELT